jgi:hypothetical protein
VAKKTLLSVKEINIASGVAAGDQSFQHTLPQNYQRLTGIGIIEKGNGGDASQYELGFYFPQDNERINSVNNQLYKFDTSCPTDQRLQKLLMEAKGQTVEISVRTLAATTAALSVQLIFRVEKD